MGVGGWELGVMLGLAEGVESLESGCDERALLLGWCRQCCCLMAAVPWKS